MPIIMLARSDRAPQKDQGWINVREQAKWLFAMNSEPAAERAFQAACPA
jgi:hypothetical protein